MADFQDLSGLPVDDTMAQMELQRRLKMAQALQETKMPEGQMIGGHFVAPSWTQQLASVYNKYQGGKAEREAMQQFGEYRKSKQAKLGQALDTLNTDVSPTAITTTEDHFVDKPLEQGMNVPTSPSYSPTSQSSEQVAQVYPNFNNQAPVQNMQGNMSVNQPITSTTYKPKSQTEIENAFFKYGKAIDNPDLISKYMLAKVEKGLTPKATKFMDMGDKQIELDENNKPTGFSLPMGIKPGSDMANQIRLAQLEEQIKQHGIENDLAQKKFNIDKNKADPLGLNNPPPKNTFNIPTTKPFTNKQGWTLHTDAQGNQAYVSPDGKQFEEAK